MKVNDRSDKRGGAFTLIELLVVVAIIVLLIGILVPSLVRARELAKQTVCQTRIRAWALGFHMYAQDYNNALPLDGFDGTTAAPIGRWDDTYLWFNGVVAYMGAGAETYNQLQVNAAAGGKPLPKAGQNSFFVCPVAGEAMAGSGDTVTNGYFDTTGWYATSPAPFVEVRPMLICYGYNSQLRNLAPSPMTWSAYPGTADVGDVAKLSLLNPASSTVLLAEKRIRPDEIATNDPNYSKDLTQNKVTVNRFAGRHKNGGNIAFADAHVEWFNNRAINKGTNKATFYNLPSIPLYWNTSGN